MSAEKAANYAERYAAAGDLLQAAIAHYEAVAKLGDPADRSELLDLREEACGILDRLLTAQAEAFRLKVQVENQAAAAAPKRSPKA